MHNKRIVEKIKSYCKDPRSIDQINKHYAIEKELSSLLRISAKEDRRTLYIKVYDELYQRAAAYHPRFIQNEDRKATRQTHVKRLSKCLSHFIKTDSSFLELGPGDCELSLEMTKYAKEVFAIDVSNQLSKTRDLPDNFKFVKFDGLNIPLDSELINVAFSNHVMEHVHPEDAFAQLKSIYAVLKKGGIYFCRVPNSLNGPHDISKYFDEVASCNHLKEYTRTELIKLFQEIGFSKVQLLVTVPRNICIPKIPVQLYEYFIGKLPFKYRQFINYNRFLRIINAAMLSPIIMGIK